tara:strand:+ start:4429 stop:4926 length:498 start_codon:yes stop_codon:yes gene_type:complete
MITKKELQKIYEWAKQTHFPLKKAPTAEGYSNKDIYISWLKGAGKKVFIRKKIMTDEVVDILLKDEIIFATFSTFESGTILNPHRDPDVYPCRYKRIQLPLRIPNRNHCFMIWDNKKILWKEGVAQVYPVMDVTHEGYNLSTKPMEFVMIDVKLDTIVENETYSQ